MADIIKFDVKMTEDEAVALYGLLVGVEEGLKLALEGEIDLGEKVSSPDEATVLGKKGLNRLINEMELYLEV